MKASDQTLVISSFLLSFLMLASGCGSGGGNDSSDGTPDAELLAAPCSIFSSVAGASNGRAKVINGITCGGVSPLGRLDLFDDEDNRGLCTASMISERHAITAAHCFDEVTFRADLVLNGQRYTVRSYVQQPGYSETFQNGRLLNDIAVIELSRPIPGVPIVALDFSGTSETEQFLIFGFGATRETDGRNVGLNPLAGGAMRLDRVSDRFLFATFDGPPESNVCFGDSGGPAVAATRPSDGRPIVIGITSTGTNALCAPGDENAYTRLSNPGTEAFIRSIVELPR